MSSKLPPLVLEEEVEEYQSFQETTEISDDRCDHRNVKFHGNTLRCTCGSGWAGPNIQMLYKAFKNQ